MPTRPYRELAESAKAKWGPRTAELRDTLGAQLEAQVTAQVTLGKDLASARTAAHLTQPELAEKAGVQQADISRIERGLGNPTRDTLVRIAEALGARLTIVPKTNRAGAEEGSTGVSPA